MLNLFFIYLKYLHLVIQGKQLEQRVAKFCSN